MLFAIKSTSPLVLNEPSQKLPEVGGNSLLPDLPTSAAVEDWVFNLLAICQKYGIILGIMVIIITFIFFKIAKVRKNTKLAQFWMFFGYGVTLLCVLLIIAPYILLAFYS